MSELMEAVLQRDDLALLDPAARRLELRSILRAHGDLGALPAIADRIDGFGVLSAFMRDPAITDVLVNGHREIWVERDGELILTDARFEEEGDLLSFVERALGAAGRRADAGHPIEDARLPDGSRLHVVMPPVGGDEPIVSIRRSGVVWRLEDLQRLGALDAGLSDELKALVADRATILVAGRTGCGKTTLVNALLCEVPPRERVVTIEETPELLRADGHHVALVARPANADGAGGIGLDRLVRAALRMRPDRLVVGEVRGDEAAIALDALSTGHDGGLLTIHARDADGAMARLARLATRASDDDSIAGALMDAIDAVVVMGRDGPQRRVEAVERT